MKHLMLVPMVLTTLSTERIPDRTPHHEARIRGAVSTTLSGSAVFGRVKQGPASFSLELGAYSQQGAVIFSRVRGERPEIGTYSITPLSTGAENGHEIHALVSLGSVERPLGAFRGMSGWVTITSSTDDRIVGEYELKAVGFLASDLTAEDREITVRGGFTAEAAPPASAFEAELVGALTTTARGSAEFGAVRNDDGRSFSLTLGPASEQGAIVLSRSGGERLGVGSYPVREEGERSGDFHGLVITGSPSHPTGVFRIQQGTLTITSASSERLEGSFALSATGFLAAEPDREDRELTVTGSFSATASGTQVTYSLR